MKPDADCPCGTGRRYVACCGRWHGGDAFLRAPDAESLMRSRYAAYVLGFIDYLQQTWHASTRPALLEPPAPDMRWLGLEVRRMVRVDDTHATVEFVARSKAGGRATRLHETSRFLKEGDRWYYVDGEIGPSC